MDEPGAVGTSFLIISPTASDNALGRACSLALVARELGTVRLVAPRTEAVWPGLSQFDVELVEVDPDEGQAAREAVDLVRGDHGCVVVWQVKPSGWTARVADLCARDLGPDVVRAFDADDDDAGLIAGERARSLRTRASIRRRDERHPGQIRRRVREAAAKAHLCTTSSKSLADHLDESCRLPVDTRWLVLPHARPAVDRLPSGSREPEAEIQLGFLGTARAHKGVEHVVAVTRNLGARLHVFSAQAAAFDGLSSDQLVRHDEGERLGSIYRELDCVLLPQLSTGAGGRFQLPAKLLDALQHRVPVVASRTPPIEEIAGRFVTVVDDWSDQAIVETAIHAAIRARPALVDHGPELDELVGGPAQSVRLASALAEVVGSSRR